MRQFLLAIAGLLILAPALHAQDAPDSTFAGVASYYHSSLHGRPTASDEIYDEARMTAAHRTLPFGTRVRVTNPRNGRSVVVRINDRGPHVGGRVIDLSKAAAREIGILGRGLARVQARVLPPNVDSEEDAPGEL